MMEKFYSALVVNAKLFPNVHQVFKPRYNKEYFKRLVAKIDSLEEHMARRCNNPSDRLDKSSLIEFKNSSKRLIALKNRVEKITAPEQFQETFAELEAIEDRILPIVISLPNRHSQTVPAADTIVHEVKSNCPREGVVKMLSHTKLSYINNCYSKSVVGPNSSYYFGVAAKLHYGIRDYFMQNLEKNSFIPVSGLCLTKSAVVEAVNSKDHKDYSTDPCRILWDDTKFTTTHLVEASREALVGFLTTLGHRSSNQPLRLVTFGSGYCTGSEWFDPDTRKASQFETVRTLAHTPSIERCSIAEYQAERDIIWNLYSNLGLPARLVHCCLSSMRSNEYDTHRVDIWLPSRSQWIETARISHYLDYITVRTGMKRGHMIDSTVYDSRAMIAAVIENNQTPTGSFVIPTVIQEYMPNKSPLINYEQRRYLVKKFGLFGHSKRARRNNTSKTNRERLMFLAAMFLAVRFMDWESIWVDYLPLNWKRFLYDNFYRPARRYYWSTIYVGGTLRPPDTPFDEMDLSHYDKSLGTRRKEIFARRLASDRLRLTTKDSANGGEDKKVDNDNGDGLDKVNE